MVDHVVGLVDVDGLPQGGADWGVEGVDPVGIPMGLMCWWQGSGCLGCWWEGGEGGLEDVWGSKGAGCCMEDWCGGVAVHVEGVVLGVGLGGQGEA